MRSVQLRGAGIRDPEARPFAKRRPQRFAFELDATLTQPVTDVQVAGGVIPTADGARERPIAFFAFVTASALTDADDLTADSNGVEDVFVAAVDTTRIDTRAFSYAIASTMRHPRCVTCHQMNVDVAADPTALPPTPFLTQPHFDGPNAIAAFDAIGGSAYTAGEKVPVENVQSGAGTRDSHWRLSVFANELMTGIMSPTSSPLSRVTVASLRDLGYEVDDAAALRERMLAAGYEESTPPNHHRYRRRVYFLDPDGNDWEFVQYFSAAPAERNEYEAEA